MLSLSSCQQKEFMNRSGALFTSEQLGSFSTIFAFGSMPTGSADRDEGDGVFIIRASIVNENLINNTNDISLELAQLPKQINSSDDVCSYLLGKLKKKIYSYLELDENWDGHEGVAPSKSCIDDAITFLSNIPASCLPDRVGVSGDGEISLFWERKGVYADFGFIGDSMFCYFINSNGVKFYGDDLAITDVSAHLSAEILYILKI